MRVRKARDVHDLEDTKKALLEHINAARSAKHTAIHEARGQCPWVASHDSTHDCFYYYNFETGETTWDKPPNFVMAVDDFIMTTVIKMQSAYRCRAARRRVSAVRAAGEGGRPVGTNLQVELINARGLPDKDLRGTSDPMCVLVVVKGDSSISEFHDQLKTAEKENNVSGSKCAKRWTRSKMINENENPDWNQTLYLCTGSGEGITGYELWIRIVDHDKLHPSGEGGDFLGQIRIPLVGEIGPEGLPFAGVKDYQLQQKGGKDLPGATVKLGWSFVRT
jgi:hypothetical protein